MLGEDFQVSMNVLKKEGIETHSEVLDFKINWGLCKHKEGVWGDAQGSELFLLLWGQKLSYQPPDLLLPPLEWAHMWHALTQTQTHQ